MTTQSKPKARTAADFKAAFDRDTIVRTKIKAGLAALLKVGPEHYAESDEEFRKLCGLQAAQLAAYRDEFSSFWFVPPNVQGNNKTAKRVWFGSAKVAARLRPKTEE